MPRSSHPRPRPKASGANQRSSGGTPHPPGSVWRRRGRVRPHSHRRSTWTSSETAVTTIRPGACRCRANPPPLVAVLVASCPGSNVASPGYHYRSATGPYLVPATSNPRSPIPDRRRPPSTDLGRNCPHRWHRRHRCCCSRSAAAREVRHSSG